MTFAVTSLYAAILTVLFLILAALVIVQRTKTGISILHGDNMTLALAIRRHGNLAEYLPLLLILMAFCEVRGLDGTWLHVIGTVAIAGRLAHVAGLSATNANHPLRIAGGTLTHLTMLVMSAYLLWSQF